jgi:NADPH:quinone reductase-like Zn-dependent oxidoreductase
MSSSLLIRHGVLAGVLAMCAGVAAAATPQEHATPNEQKAIVQTGTGGPEVMKLTTVPVLSPGKDQVLVHVYAAAVNPTDWKTRAGLPNYTPVANVNIPGGDVAGVIEQLGAGVTTLKVGEPVFGVISRTGSVLNGGYSHYALVDAVDVVPKPKSMTYAEASGLGVASVTGVRAVIETHLKKGQRVLITGEAGGVGSAATQAAKDVGAYVIGTATPVHDEYLKSLGADEIIDYTQVKFEDKVHDVDAVIDTVGTADNTTERAMSTLKKGGWFISVAAKGYEDKCAAAGIQCVARGTASTLGRAVYDAVGRLADSGKLKVKIDKSFHLEQAGDAQLYGEQGHTEGKIVLLVDPYHAIQK